MLDTAVDIVGTFDSGMDSLYASFGFLTEQKDSPYPWMMAACAVSGALPHFLLFLFVIEYG
jgi:hypothetical protein